MIVLVIVTGVGGKHFVDPPAAPATAESVLTFAATIAGFTITWSTFSTDYTVYFHPSVSRCVVLQA